MKIGDTVPVAALVKTLDEYGYVRVDTVEGAGQYSLRGDILDIFVPANDYPLRLEFFGDEIRGWADQHRAGDAAGAEGEARQRKTFFVRLPRQRQADRADAAAGTGGRLRAEQDFGEERGDDAAFDPARHDEGDRQVGHGTEQFFGLLDVADPEAAARNGSEHFGVDQFAQRQMDGLAAAPGRLFEGPDRGQVLPLRRPPVDDMAQDLLPHLMDFVSQFIFPFGVVSFLGRTKRFRKIRHLPESLCSDVSISC